MINTKVFGLKGVHCRVTLHSLSFSTKPNLLFFDVTKCVQVATVSELLQGSIDASTIFTCPTPQVQYLYTIVTTIRVYLYQINLVYVCIYV